MYVNKAYCIFSLILFIFFLLVQLTDEKNINDTLTYQNFLFKSAQKKEVKHLVDLITNEDTKEIYISMKNAISYIFQKIQNETTEITLTQSSDFQLIPKNIIFLEPRCQSTTEATNPPKLTYNQCSMLIIIKNLTISNAKRNIATFKNYLAEFYFESMSFTLNNNLIVFTSTGKPTLNYNKEESIFNIPSVSTKLHSQMTLIGSKSYSQLLESFSMKAGTYAGTNLYIEGFLGSVFNVLYMNGPFINVEETEEEKIRGTEDKVTYISYANPKMTAVVLTKDRIFISQLKISFDFAIDFDINWNEGSMTLSDFVFTKEEGGSNSQRKIEFTPIMNDIRKDYIINTFYKQFEIARENYTQIGREEEYE